MGADAFQGDHASDQRRSLFGGSQGVAFDIVSRLSQEFCHLPRVRGDHHPALLSFQCFQMRAETSERCRIQHEMWHQLPLSKEQRKVQLLPLHRSSQAQPKPRRSPRRVRQFENSPPDLFRHARLRDTRRPSLRALRFRGGARVFHRLRSAIFRPQPSTHSRRRGEQRRASPHYLR